MSLKQLKKEVQDISRELYGYDQERTAKIDELIRVASTAYLNGKENTLIFQSYLEGYGGLIHSCFRDLDLDQLTSIDEVRFIADGVGHVEFYFKYGITITDALKGYEIEATNKGRIKLIARIQWVDRY